MKHIRVNDKIRLEQIDLSMAPIIFKTIDANRNYLNQWLPFVESTNNVSDTEKFISSVANKTNKKDNIYSIWYKEKFVGLIGFKDTDWVNLKTEIGYWLAEAMQGKGIVSLSLQSLTQFAFKKQKLNRIQLKIAEKNKKSELVAQRAGFFFEGIERAGERHKNTYLNLKVYSLLKTD